MAIVVTHGCMFVLCCVECVGVVIFVLSLCFSVCVLASLVLIHMCCVLIYVVHLGCVGVFDIRADDDVMHRGFYMSYCCTYMPM